MGLRLFFKIKITKTIERAFNLPDIIRPVFALVADHACDKF